MTALIRTLVIALLRLRYRVRIAGLQEVAARGQSGILFLPNHPALVDPLILVTHLHKRFQPRPLADEAQLRRPLVGWFTRRVGVRIIRDMSQHGVQERDQIAAVVASCAEGLQSGENILLYPSGHLYRSRLEDLRGNSAVELILERAPQARVVLVRTTGLWGSSFSYAAGKIPDFMRLLRRHAWTLVKNAIFFVPRRDVSIELWEPPDLPREAGRAALNAFIERWYNEAAPPNTYVPYAFWEEGGRRELPDPPQVRVSGSADEIPEGTREIVLSRLREASGISALSNEMRLAQDLGMDSLARAELLIWLGQEFGFHTSDVTALATVGDVLLAARGQAVAAKTYQVAPIAARWWQARSGDGVQIPDGATLPSAFLAQAARDPRRAIVADERSGVRTYRDVITAILALKPEFEALPGERVGIMLPASVGAVVAYLAALFAGKTPLMINWTTGPRNIAHSLEITGAQRIVTAREFVKRLEARGVELAAISERFVFLEDVRKRLSAGRKLGAALRARFSWRSLRQVHATPIAAILVTSGSEALPKAVPLTHLNLLSNLRAVPDLATIRESDCLLGMLPPFHSFGLTVTMLLPLLAGVRVIYHPDPTEGWALAALIDAYKVTVLCGTPTFLSGICRSAQPGQLASLRIAVTGAEQCPARVYNLLAQHAPQAVILEGYGVTECSPIISATRERDARPSTIGWLLPGYEAALLHPETGEAVADGEPGMLLVRGPSVFGGYLGEAKSPFVEHEGKTWYRTGDLVAREADGALRFVGRLKRFIKLGGEMISLPAIESVLLAKYANEADEGPVLGVEASSNEAHPEIVLFTTLDLDRAAANAAIRAAQLSALHNITRVERVESIPVLGTGKTDYKALRELIHKK